MNYYRKEHPLKPKKCYFCDKEFLPNHGSRNYCSLQCRVDRRLKRNWKLSPRKCLHCGKDFWAKHGLQLYCNEACQQLFREERNKPKKREKPCKTCGKPFLVKSGKIYCSADCKPKKCLKTQNRPILDKVCAICGSNFQSFIESRKFCSPQCRKKKENRRNRKTRIYSSIPKQPCESCGFDNLSAIHRHHVNPNLGNESEIVCLCANCHYIYHAKIGWNGGSENKTRQFVLETIKSPKNA